MLIEIIIVRQLCVLCLFYVYANRDSGMLTGLPRIIQLVKSWDHLETEFWLLYVLDFIMTSTLGTCKERITQKNHCLCITCSICLLCCLQCSDLWLDISGTEPSWAVSWMSNSHNQLMESISPHITVLWNPMEGLRYRTSTGLSFSFWDRGVINSLFQTMKSSLSKETKRVQSIF